MTTKEPLLAFNHISVDCVVFGFDGSSLDVLLIRRTGEEGGEVFHDMKLPGSLIYKDEELDDAARRVLAELTGLKNVNLTQFHTFGSKERTRDPKDVHWLERAQKAKVERIVTVAYFSMIKIDRSLSRSMEGKEALWVEIGSLPQLAFDHNEIIQRAREYMSRLAYFSPDILFSLLPRKFSATQLRTLYECVFGKKIDQHNFYKTLAAMPYVVPLDEKETGVAHRAARLYTFSRQIYNRKK